MGLPKRLAFGHDDVGPVIARPLQQAQADRIDRHDQQGAGRVRRPRPTASTSSRQPKKFGCCTNTQAVSSSTAAANSAGEIVPSGVPTVTSSTSRLARYVARIWRYSGCTLRGGDHARVPAGGVDGHQHGFGRGAAAVVQAGVGDVHAGQLGDQRLVFEEHLQVALAGLGLIGRVRRVELAARGDRSRRPRG